MMAFCQYPIIIFSNKNLRQSILCRNYQHVSPFFKTPRRKKSAPAFQRVPILLPYSALWFLA